MVGGTPFLGRLEQDLFMHLQACLSHLRRGKGSLCKWAKDPFRGGLPDLTSKNTGCLIKFKFEIQINKE